MSELEHTAVSQVDSPPAEVQAPRLSIFHLMLWTLCSSIYLGLHRAILEMQSQVPVRFFAIKEVSGVIQACIIGAAVAGTVVLISMRVRGNSPMLRQPGHWFLFITAVLYVLYVPLVLITQLVQLSFVGGKTSFYLICAVAFAFPPIGYVLATVRVPAIRWKVLFALLAAVACSQFLIFVGIGLNASFVFVWLSILSATRTWGGLLLSAAIFFVSLADVSDGQRRDWLHWTGIATHVAESGIAVLWVLASWFIP